MLKVPVDRNGPISFVEFHAVDGILDVLGTPPGQGSGAEGDAGESESGENETHVASQALQVLLVVGGLQLK